MLYGESCFIAYWIGNFLALFFLGIFSFYNIVMTRNEVVKLKSCLGFCPFFRSRQSFILFIVDLQSVYCFGNFMLFIWFTIAYFTCEYTCYELLEFSKD